MNSKKGLIKYCLYIFFFFAHFIFAAPQQSLQELKNKIVGNTFQNEIFKQYEFYILNNKIEFNHELDFLKNLKPSFETKYLKSLIFFRKNEFKESFNILFNLLDENPKYFAYYELLTKIASITNNESKIENKLEKMDSEKYKNYLQAQLAYQKAMYQESKDKFNYVLASDSTSFETLYMIAYCYRNLGDYNTSLKYFNKASEMVKKNNPLIAKVTVAIGSLFYLSGNYDKAKALYKKGLKVASETGNNIEKIKALLNLGMILDEEGAIVKARINFEEATKLAEQIGDNELEATVLTEYAVSYTYTGEVVNARKKYETGFILFQKLKNKNRIAFTAINIGNSYLNISNYKNSIKYYEIGLNEAGENIRAKMLALRGLGDVYTNLSDYSKALDYYANAKILAKQIKDVPADAKINIGLGVLYYNLDMPQKALEILKESENSLSESENPYLKLEIEQKIGILYNSIDSLSTAYSYLKNSADLANKYGDVYYEILSKTFLAEISLKQGNVNSAHSLLNKTIKTTSSIGYNQLLGLQYLIMSDISKTKFEKTNQLKNIIQAKYYADKANDLNTLIKANQKLGEFYAQQKEVDKAEEFYQTAVNIIDLNFNRLFTKADIQIKFFSNYYSVYNSLINLYLSENRFLKAFEVLEKSKARNSSQNMVNLKLGRTIGSDILLSKYYDLVWKLNSGLYNGTELASTNIEFQNVKDSIAQLNPTVAKYLSNSKFSLNNVKKSLEKSQYIISYFVQNNYIYAFQFSTNGLKTKKIDISLNKLNELKNAISPYYNNKIGGNEISFNRDLFAFNADGANNFYKKVVQPIISDIPTNSKIIFSLPSELITIPFEFLITKSATDSSPYLLDDKTFLIDDYVISYTPSASIWKELQGGNNPKTQTALLIGDPFFDTQNQSISETRGFTEEIDFFSRNMNYLSLEYSAEEIQSIGSLLNNEKIYLSKDATETIFKKNVEDASIVHLSTHSFLYKNSPLILFSNNDKENDGFLEVGEILKLNLKTNMVVLSSCKSGLGRVDKAEGIIGMQKAFFDAGAKSVMVSLWDVNDKYTSIFMKYFYSFLSDGYSKSEALRFAKLKFIKQNNPNPYYWSAFTISGDDKPINVQISNYSFLLVILLLLSIPLAYLFYLKKYRKHQIV